MERRIKNWRNHLVFGRTFFPIISSEKAWYNAICCVISPRYNAVHVTEIGGNGTMALWTGGHITIQNPVFVSINRELSHTDTIHWKSGETFCNDVFYTGLSSSFTRNALDTLNFSAWLVLARWQMRRCHISCSNIHLFSFLICILLLHPPPLSLFWCFFLSLYIYNPVTCTFNFLY